MNKTLKAVVFAPFWREKGHVGNYRVDRFVRWLSAEGFYIVLVRAGSFAGQRTETWGVELTVRDPLGFYRDAGTDDLPVKELRPNKLRTWVASRLFNPDPGVIWARVAAIHPNVLEHSAGASFVIASSPPESAHVGAAALAKRLKVKLVVDMRDGWLDEPLKPLLRNSRLQRWREGRLERALLQQADRIFITSSVWKSLLVARLPFTQSKAVVLTNGYPPNGMFNFEKSRSCSANEPLSLVHAGRFTGSRHTQKVSLLLEPLFLGLAASETHGIVTLLGRLETEDLDEIAHWQPQYKAKGWTIEVKATVPREEMMNLLCQADGLLLLSASDAAIPSKLFEYLPLGKPIFAATTQSSSVWKIGASLPQVYLSNCENASEDASKAFIDTCRLKEYRFDIPEDFGEETLSRIFIANISSV